MFEGRFTNKLDDKGRVALPAKYREALAASGQDKLMITAWDVEGSPCLEAYDARSWQDLVVRIQSKEGAFGEDRSLFETMYIGEAQPCQPDKQGRILLPQSLRDHAQLTDDVIFVGVHNRFQVFNPIERQKLMEQYRISLREKRNRFNAVV
jgi:MraZ protein